MIKILLIFSAIILIMIFIALGLIFTIIKMIERIENFYALKYLHGKKVFLSLILLFVLAIILIALGIFMTTKAILIEEEIKILFP